MKKIIQGIVSLIVISQLIFSSGINVVANTINNIKKQNNIKDKKETISKYSPFTLQSARQMLSNISENINFVLHSSHVSHRSHVSHASHASHVSHYSSSSPSHYSSVTPIPAPTPTPMPTPMPTPIPEKPSTQEIEKKDEISVLNWEVKQKNIGLGKYYVIEGILKNNCSVKKLIKVKIITYDYLEKQISTHYCYNNPFDVLPNEENNFNIVLVYNPDIYNFKLILEWE